MPRNDFIKENIDLVRGVNNIPCNVCKKPLAKDLLKKMRLSKKTEYICSECLPDFLNTQCRLDLIVNKKTKHQMHELGEVLVEKNLIPHNKLTQVFLYSFRQLLEKHKKNKKGIYEYDAKFFD